MRERYRRDTLRTIISNARRRRRRPRRRSVDFFGDSLAATRPTARPESGIVCNLRPQDQLSKTKRASVCRFPTPEVRDDDGNEVAPNAVGDHCSVAPESPQRRLGPRRLETRATFRGDWFSAGDDGSATTTRLHLPRRSQEGSRHHRRHQRLSARNRGSAVRPSWRCGSLRHWRAGRLLGRDAEGLCGDRAAMPAQRGRIAGISPRQACRLQDSETVEFIAALPRNTAGKVLKTELRASAQR